MGRCTFQLCKMSKSLLIACSNLDIISCLLEIFFDCKMCTFATIDAFENTLEKIAKQNVRVRHDEFCKITSCTSIHSYLILWYFLHRFKLKCLTQWNAWLFEFLRWTMSVMFCGSSFHFICFECNRQKKTIITWLTHINPSWNNSTQHVPFCWPFFLQFNDFISYASIE